MCISFPGRVLAIDGADAIVEVDGRRRRASLLLVPDAAVDDRVLVSAGTVLQVLSSEAAADLERTLAAARDSLPRSASPAGSPS